MYFHPLVLAEAQARQVSAAAQDFARLWLEGVDRQRRLDSEAAMELSVRQRENLRMLSESTDVAQFVERCFVCASPATLDLLQASVRFGEIAADGQHQAVALTDRHAKALSRMLFEPKLDGDSQRVVAADNRSAHRRQVTA
jgi:hypothetical protein